MNYECTAGSTSAQASGTLKRRFSWPWIIELGCVVFILLLLHTQATATEQILFQETFSGDLSRWTGKNGGPHNGQIVVDPLNSTNRVLNFMALNVSGDIFTLEPIQVAMFDQILLKFEYLGLAQPGSVRGNFGGFVGLSVRLNLDVAWIAGTQVTATGGSGFTSGVQLIDDGVWHSYEVDLTGLISSNKLTAIRILVEDWLQAGGVAGDAYFDNLRITGRSGGGNLPPSVSIVSPSHGASFAASENLTVLAEAFEADGTISKVEFYAGSTKLGEGAAPPYSISWTSAPVGFHWLTAIATDNQGAIGVSRPVEIAVVPPDCGSGVSSNNTNAPIASTSEAQIYFGQDPSRYPPFGLNQVPRPNSTPKSSRAAALFLARLPGVGTESFESFAANTVPEQLRFGTNTVNIEGGQRIVEVPDLKATNNGEFPISGAKGLELIGDSGTGVFSLDFSSPQAAFGFYATDIELNGLNVTLVRTNGARNTLTVPVSLPQGSGGALFWGVTDRTNPFIRVELGRNGNLEDGFLFDDLTIATPEGMLPEVVWPEISITAAAPAPEGDSDFVEAKFTLSLSRPTTHTVSVEYFTLDGTAQNATDYLPVSGAVAIRPGQTNASVAIRVLGDTFVETDEIFRVQLRRPSNALLARCEAIGTILNDDSPQTNRPPIVRITDPLDHTAFRPEEGRVGVSLLITAEAHDDERVERVDFYAGSVRLGSATAPPYQFAWTQVPIGDFKLKAVATDNRGLQGTSEVVRIAVTDLGGEVAIVRAIAGDEVNGIRDHLLEMGLSSRVFDLDVVTPELLDSFQLVIVHLGDAAPMTSPAFNALLALRQSRREPHPGGMPIYFIGERLTGAGAGLASTERTVLENLIHLRSTPSLKSGRSISFVNEGEAYNIRNGQFGLVRDFDYPRPVEPTSGTGDGTVIAWAGEAAALVTYPAVNAPDLGEARSVTQTFQVTFGDASSLDSRRGLFQNAVCWLLRCIDCGNASLGVPEEVEVLRVSVGEPFRKTIAVLNNGACEVRAARLEVAVPSGLELMDVEVSRGGDWSWDAEHRLATVAVGRVGRGDAGRVDVSFRFRSTSLGEFRTEGHARSNNTLPRHLTWDIVVEAGTRPYLLMDPVPAGQWRLRLLGTVAQPYQVQRAELAPPLQWQPWTNVVGPVWLSPAIDPPFLGKSQIYRAVTR